MPIETEKSSSSAGGGVSVADAFGLPKDWTLAKSLGGVAGEGDKREAAPAADEAEDAAAEVEKPEDAAAGAADDGEKPPADGSESEVAADKKAADKAAEDKRVAAEAAAKKKADPKTTKPDPKAAPAKAAAKDPKTAKVEVPALGAEKKVKVGDKEFSEKELQAALDAAQKPKPEEKKADEPAKVETAEEKAQRESDTKATEQKWLEDTAKALEAPAVTEKEIDTILMGGKEAVDTLQTIRKRDMAATLLGARKDIFEQLKPVLQAVDAMNARHMQSEDTRMFNDLISGHPKLSEYRDLVDAHANALVRDHPEKVSKMSEKEFNEEVANLTTAYIRRYNPAFGQEAAAEGGEGGEAAAVEGAGKPAAAAPAKAAAAAPAKRKSPPPPAGTLPASAAAGGKGNGDFQKTAVASMMA